MKRHKLWLCDSFCSYRVFWQHGRLNSEPRDPRPRLAPASPNLCQASCQITQAAAVTAQRLLYSRPSLLQSCNYFRQNRTLERWAAHFKGQEFRQSTPTLSDTAGVTRGISLALVFMYIPQNLSCSPIFSPFSAPSLFIFPILLGVSLTYFLIFFSRAGPLFSFVHLLNYMLASVLGTAVTQKAISTTRMECIFVRGEEETE